MSKRICTKCGSKQVARILYGLPVFSEQLEKDMEAGKIVLGGCCVSDVSPTHHCITCEYEWNKKDDEIKEVLSKVKVLARKYYSLTHKPLGVTGEIAEYEASCLLNLQLAQARAAGYDAIDIIDGVTKRIQIKGRCINESSKNGKIGKIDLKKEWDLAYLVLLDKNYECQIIYSAEREIVARALLEPGSKSRNLKGALSISKFKQIGKVIWSKQI